MAVAAGLAGWAGSVGEPPRAVARFVAAPPQRDLYPDPGRLTAAPTSQPFAEAPPSRLVWPAAPSVPNPVPPAPPPPRIIPNSVFQLPHSRLVSLDGGLDVPVGAYTDCSGNSPIDAAQADLDPCFLGRLYFVGHSPGVFSPLLAMHPGATITWYDARGIPLRLRIVSVRDFKRNSTPLFLSQPDVVAQFQTCLTADGAYDKILDAVRA